MEFDGPPTRWRRPEFVTDVGQKQDELIKKALGG